MKKEFGYLLIFLISLISIIYSLLPSHVNYVYIKEHLQNDHTKARIIESPTNQIPNENQMVNENQILIGKVTDLRQQLREAKGKITMLSGEKHVKFEKTEAIEAAMWADTVSLLQRKKYSCFGPHENNNDKEIWNELKKVNSNVELCGCLKSKKVNTKELNIDIKPNEQILNQKTNYKLNCRLPDIWLLTIGDSTMAQFTGLTRDLLSDSDFTQVKYSPSQIDTNEIKQHINKLRTTLSTSGRLGVYLNYDDDFLYTSKKHNISILISKRDQMGLNLAKFQAALENPLEQLNIPHLPKGGSIVLHPSLDEPYFVKSGSQILDLLEKQCIDESIPFKDKQILFNQIIEKMRIEKPFILAGSALWDTGGDSNMMHRNERSRCGMTIPSVTKYFDLVNQKKTKMVSVTQMLYKRRIDILFDVANNLYGKNYFTFRTSGLGSQSIINEHKVEKLTNNSIPISYVETGLFNTIAKESAKRKSISYLDYELIHKEFNYTGQDIVHPINPVVVKGLKKWFEHLKKVIKNSNEIKLKENKLKALNLIK